MEKWQLYLSMCTIRLKSFKPLSNIVERHYSAVHFITILHTAIRWQHQNINQILDSQKTSHSSSSWASYGKSFVRIWEKIDYVIMAPHCNCDESQKTVIQHIPVNFHNIKQIPPKRSCSFLVQRLASQFQFLPQLSWINQIISGDVLVGHSLQLVHCLG